jgi:selenide, water dikinase
LLSEVLSRSTAARAFSNLLVGTETSDDAAVYRLNDTQAIVATTDFFMPVVDDPHDFGRIAATNAISDVYAMGATPFLALALLGMPADKIPAEVIARIVEGGRSVCDAANIPIAGGHSIDTLEPIYGLVVLGLVHPEKVKRNRDARAGDALILGKPLGVGIMSAAIKKGALQEESYRQMIATTTQLNTPGMALADLRGVHALTDVTGFGLLGHLLGICRGSNLCAEIEFERIPVLSAARQLVEQGHATGASQRNWASYGHAVTIGAGRPEWHKKLLTDPQTSGGLLVACDSALAPEVLKLFTEHGFEHAAQIGRLVPGEPSVRVL